MSKYDVGELLSDLRVHIRDEILKAKKEKGFTLKELGFKSGVHPSVISRVIYGKGDTRLSTILKILAPLGKTLTIVPIEEIID